MYVWAKKKTIHYLCILVSVLLSASVERFSVSRMRDFLMLNSVHQDPSFLLVLATSIPNVVAAASVLAETAPGTLRFGSVRQQSEDDSPANTAEHTTQVWQLVREERCF